MNQFRFLFALLITSIPLSLAAVEASNPAEAAQRFRDMLKTVDRIVLVQTYEPRYPEFEYIPDGPLPEIKDPAAIASLGSVVEFEKLDFACACEHTPEINFYSGKKLLFTLTLFEHSHLRCVDGPWSGDAVMTESSAARFRQWFAERGYMGFFREHEMMVNRGEKEKDERARFIALFPENVRPVLASGRFQSLTGKTDADITKTAASFPSKKDLVLACWRALAEIKTWDWDINDAHTSFIYAVLESANEHEVKDALGALPPDDNRAWAGAYIYASKTGSSLDDDWFVKLARYIFHKGGASDRVNVIRNLNDRSSDTALQELLAISQAMPPYESARDSNYTEDEQTYSPQCYALLLLASHKQSDVRKTIVEKLARSNGPGDTAALQVALAHFDGPETIKAEHFEYDAFGIADTAWKLSWSQPGFNPPLDFLARAVNSKSRLVRVLSEGLLREKGLRPLTEEEQALDSTETLKSAKTLEALDLLIAKIEVKPKSSTKLIDRTKTEFLHHQRAKIHLASGCFEEARTDLRKSGYSPDVARDRALVEQTLGRFNEAAMVVRGTLPEEKPTAMVSAYFENCGYLFLAQAKFDEAAFAFRAARSLPSKSYNLVLFQTLSLVLAGKLNEAKLTEHEMDPKLALWPYNGLRLIQERTNEDEVISQIKTSYRKDSDDLCEAHFVISVLRRVKNDFAGEREHLLAALATKRYTSQAYLLATIRLRELETLATAKL